MRLYPIEVHETTDEERNICGNEPEYTIDTYELFKAFAGAIGNIQNAIDDIAAAVIREHSIDREGDKPQPCDHRCPYQSEKQRRAAGISEK